MSIPGISTPFPVDNFVGTKNGVGNNGEDGDSHPQPRPVDISTYGTLDWSCLTLAKIMRSYIICVWGVNNLVGVK